MDFELITVEQSLDHQHRSDDSSTLSEHFETIPTLDNDKFILEKKQQKRLYPWIESITARMVAFAIFANISLIVGVLVVYFTVPRPDHTCQLKFQSTIKSSRIQSSQPRTLAVGDFDNNQQIDLVVANSGTNTIVVFILDINATIISQQTYSTGVRSRPCSLAVADFNQDGYIDIAVANNGTNNIGLFFNNRNGSFLTQQTLSTGSYRPSFVAVADFNHDNRSDIAVVYYGTDNIGIHLGNENGAFQNVKIYSTGYDSFPYSLAVGDLNNDNHLDIVVANYGTNNIGIFFGNADGSFTSQQIHSISSNSRPTSVVLGDLNQDQQLDIIISLYGSSSIGILFNQGNATFRKQTIYLADVQSRPRYITVGYVNPDNYLDVVVVDSENDRIHVLPGFGNTSFDVITTYDSISGSHPSVVVIADIDKDNQSDLLVTNYDTNSINILSGYSSQPSVRQMTYFVGYSSRPSSVVVFDFNGDGKLDAAVNNFGRSTILVFNGIDNGKFITGQTYPLDSGSSPKHINLGDVNNDGQMDMIVTNLAARSVSILFGAENGTFTAATSYSTGTGTQPWLTALGDFNNDNRLDIVSPNWISDDMSIFLNDGNGNFSNMIRYPIGNELEPLSLTVGNLNNDSYSDIVVSASQSGSVGVFLGYGNGTFLAMTTYSGDCIGYAIVTVLADVNRDNYQDIIRTCSDDGNILICLGIGDGTFQPCFAIAGGSDRSPLYVVVADLNDDQHPDMAVTCSLSSELLVFYGDGTGNFTLSRIYSTGVGTNSYALAIADLNNDNRLEYLVTYWGTGYLAVLTEYYAAQFSRELTYSTGSAPHPHSLATGDFNNDNQTDVVVANSDTDDISILFGLNNGLFTTPITYSIGTDSSPQYVLTGDIDRDNNVDIVTANSKENTLSVIMNYGNESFASQRKYSTGSDSSPSSVMIGDVNNDGRNDLVITNQQSDRIGMFIGFDYASFQNQITYSVANTKQSTGVIVSDFNSDKHVDIAVVYQQTN
ncbi:unnamed protein product, partial [Adineta ricciae]